MDTKAFPFVRRARQIPAPLGAVRQVGIGNRGYSHGVDARRSSPVIKFCGQLAALMPYPYIPIVATRASGVKRRRVPWAVVAALLAGIAAMVQMLAPELFQGRPYIVITIVAGIVTSLAMWLPSLGTESRGLTAPRLLAPLSWSIGAVSDKIRRDDILGELNDRVQRNTRTLILWGRSGAGKTYLARQFAEHLRVNEGLTYGWEISATDRSSLVGGLANVHRMLVGYDGTLSDNDAAKEAISLLSNLDSWFLLLDGATDGQLLAEWLPRGAGIVMVTTTSRNVATLGDHIEITGFDEPTALSFLRSELSNEVDPDVANRIWRSLDGLPLALAQAAAYCRVMHVPLIEFQKVFDATPLASLENGKLAARAGLDRTLQINVHLARKKSSQSRQLLFMLALLAEAPVPTGALIGNVAQPSRLGLALRRPSRAARLFQTLSDLALITETSAYGLELHGLTRILILDLLRRDWSHRKLRNRQRLASHWLMHVYPRHLDAFADWHLATVLAPHVRHILQVDRLYESRWISAMLLRIAYARYCMKQGDFTTADKLLAEAKGVAISRWWTRRFDRIIERVDMQERAYLLDGLGRYVDTLAIRSKLHEQDVKRFGEKHPRTMGSTISLAAALHSAGDFQAAERLYESLIEHMDGDKDPKKRGIYVAVMQNYGILLKQLGNIGAAQAIFERLVEVYGVTLPSDHIDVIAANVHLAHTLVYTDPDRGLQIASAAADMLSSTRGGEFLGSFVVKLVLVDVLTAVGEEAKALNMARELLDVVEERLPNGHIACGLARARLAEALHYAGSLEEARVLFDIAFNELKVDPGPGHFYTRRTAARYADLLDSIGDLDGASALREQSEDFDAVAMTRMVDPLIDLVAKASAGDEQAAADIEGIRNSIKIPISIGGEPLWLALLALIANPDSDPNFNPLDLPPIAQALLSEARRRRLVLKSN